MRCPKCGYINPDDEIFCENCDLDLCQYEKTRFSLNSRAILTSFAGFIFGLTAFALTISNYKPFGIGFSLIGIFFSSYSMGITMALRMSKRQKIILFLVAAIGSILSAISFVFGLKFQFL